MSLRRLPALLALLAVAGCAGTQPVTLLPPEPEFAAPFVELRPLTGTAGLPGEMAEGGAGDWLLGNERLAVVIGKASRRGVFARTGGNILDAAPTGGEDQLRGVFLYLDDTFLRQALYDTVLVAPPDTTREVRELIARGRDSANPLIGIETRYRLEPARSFVEIESRLVNRGTLRISGFPVGDVLQWGWAEPFAPGPGGFLEGYREPVPWVGASASGTAYLYRGASDRLEGIHGDTWSDVTAARVDLAPGDTVRVLRRLFVVSGSEAEAAEAVARVEGHAHALVEADASDDAGEPLAGVRVEALDPAGRTMMRGRTDAQGRAILPVAPGAFRLEVSHPGRGTRRSREFRVEVGRGHREAFVLGESARITLTGADTRGRPLPVRWTFEGVKGTDDPRFGPAFRGPAAGNRVYAAEGRMTLGVPPGRYRVTASRGPGYEAWQQEVDLSPGREARLDARLAPLDLPGDWVAADFHVHALPSPDSNVSLADRARALACEGIDWFVSTDHGRRTNYASVMDTLQLAAPLRMLVGEEATTDTLGHFSAFPLAPIEGAPGMGALGEPWPVPSVLFERLRMSGTGTLVQVNHPRTGKDGYFDRFAYDPRARAGGADMSLDFDLLEVLNGKRPRSFEAAWKDWMSILARDRRVTGVGNSDAHGLAGDEGGLPRNLVLVERSPNGEVTEEAFLDAVRGGRVQVTTGPFIDFTLEGESPGGTVTSDGVVRGHLRVLAPSWVDVRRVLLVVNGQIESILVVRGQGRTVRFDEPVSFELDRPGFVQVRVEGREGMAPVVGQVGNEDVLPLAFTNPIWVVIPRGSR